MKKLLSILTLCMGLCCVSCYDDSALVERIDALEKNAIASINDQISAIKASITSLEGVDKELKATIQTLESKDRSLQNEIEKLKSEDTSLKGDIEKLEEELASVQNEIASLKEEDSSLETKIGELKIYVDDEIFSMEDWATATFATLEQYDSLCVVLTSIETSISDLKKEFTKNLSDAISNSEESMKDWVNEQLTGYWTIAETQAILDTLKQTQTEEIEKLFTDLADAKEDMTEAYTTAISTAIEELDGKLSDEITKINDELTKRMDNIEDRLSTIEETLKNLTRDFSISFDDYDIGILAGGTTSVGYTITGTTEKTTVKALGQNGWSAKVTPDGTDKGKITVTAPNPLTEDEIIVLVYDGEYRTIMSSINFVTGVVTPSQTAVELDAEAGTVDITVTSNLNYKVSISEEAKDWLSVVETKSTKTETITFAYTANEFTIRHADVTFCDDANNVLTKVSFVQQGSAIEVTLTEAGTLLSMLGTDVYQSLKSLKVKGNLNGDDIITLRKMVALKNLDLSDANIVKGGSPYYRDSKEYYTEDNVLGKDFFITLINLEEVKIPKTTKEMYDCFEGLSKLHKVTLYEGLRSIGSYCFYTCWNIESIIIPEGVETIGNAAFQATSITQITIPSSVQYLFAWCFDNCPIKEVRLKGVPSNFKLISPYLFDDEINNVYETATLYIPKGTYEEYSITDFGKFKNIIEE